MTQGGMVFHGPFGHLCIDDDEKAQNSLKGIQYWLSRKLAIEVDYAMSIVGTTCL